MSIAPITNLAQAIAMSGPYGAIRYESGSGLIAYPDGQAHLARDIYLPPGSPIYAPFDAIWDHWGTANEDGSDTMGYVGVMRDDAGYTWRFIHVAKLLRAAGLSKGEIVKKGTFLGTTSFHKLGPADSHLHLDVFPPGVAATSANFGRRVDPLPVLGVAGFNALTQGGSGLRNFLVIAALAAAGYFLFKKP